MKRLKYMISLGVVLILITFNACGMQSENTSKGLKINTLPVETEGNTECTMVSSNGENLFYVLSEQIPYSNYDKTAKIIKVDLDTKMAEVIYENESVEGFYFSELRAAEDYIVWEMIDENKLVINKMDLETREVHEIYTSDSPNIPVLLSIYDENVIWYDLSGVQPVVQIYNVKTDEIRNVKDVKVNTPYERIEICDGIAAFLSAEDEMEGKQKIILYDLETGHELKSVVIEEKLPIRNLCANDRYFTYMLSEEEVNYSLYAYDYLNDRLIELNSEDEMYIFSYRLMGQKVLVNEKDDNDIIAIEIESGKTKNMTESLDIEHNFYMDGNWGDLYYNFNDVEIPEIVYFTVS